MLLADRASGPTLPRTASTSAALMTNAMPVMIAVPSAGCVPVAPRRAPITYTASDTPAPTPYANARVVTEASSSGRHRRAIALRAGAAHARRADLRTRRRPMADAVGFIGLGNMGRPMALNLAQARFPL